MIASFHPPRAPGFPKNADCPYCMLTLRQGSRTAAGSLIIESIAQISQSWPWCVLQGSQTPGPHRQTSQEERLLQLRPRCEDARGPTGEEAEAAAAPGVLFRTVSAHAARRSAGYLSWETASLASSSLSSDKFFSSTSLGMS